MYIEEGESKFHDPEIMAPTDYGFYGPQNAFHNFFSRRWVVLVMGTMVIWDAVYCYRFTKDGNCSHITLSQLAEWGRTAESTPLYLCIPRRCDFRMLGWCFFVVRVDIQLMDKLWMLNEREMSVPFIHMDSCIQRQASLFYPWISQQAQCLPFSGVQPASPACNFFPSLAWGFQLLHDVPLCIQVAGSSSNFCDTTVFHSVHAVDGFVGFWSLKVKVSIAGIPGATHAHFQTLVVIWRGMRTIPHNVHCTGKAESSKWRNVTCVQGFLNQVGWFLMVSHRCFYHECTHTLSFSFAQ